MFASTREEVTLSTHAQKDVESIKELEVNALQVKDIGYSLAAPPGEQTWRNYSCFFNARTKCMCLSVKKCDA